MNQTGADTVAEFDVPWWWRTDFARHPRPGQSATLVVNGVVGSANVWVNGHEVGASATVTGAYTRFRFNVGSLAGSGTNSLAIEVNPSNPNTMFTLDDVDWNQVPPDNNTGIEFPVQLEVDKALTDGGPAALHTGHIGITGRHRAGPYQRDVRHPDRDVVPDGLEHGRAERRPGVQDQRSRS